MMTRTRSLVLLPVLFGLAGCHGSARNLATPGQALRPCPSTPNCVSTEATDRRHAMPPIAFSWTFLDAQVDAREALLQQPRTRITLEAPGYLRAESRSRIFGFVDDVEVVVDGSARVIRFRSASRVGRGDMGVNRKRMEQFTDAFRFLDGAGPGQGGPYSERP